MSEKSIVAAVLAVSCVAAAALLLQSLGDEAVSSAGSSSSYSSVSSDSFACEPYRCADGTVIESCAPDGHVINYFADPCLTHGGYAPSSASL